MKQNLSCIAAYGFAALLIGVILWVILTPAKKRSNADCHVQE